MSKLVHFRRGKYYSYSKKKYVYPTAEESMRDFVDYFYGKTDENDDNYTQEKLFYVLYE